MTSCIQIEYRVTIGLHECKKAFIYHFPLKYDMMSKEKIEVISWEKKER